MKRREFIQRTVGLVGAVTLPGLVKGESLPCPPPEVRIGDGPLTASNCGQSGNIPAWWSRLPESTWVGVAAGDGTNGGSLLPNAWQRGNTLSKAWAASMPKPKQTSDEPTNSSYSGWAVNQQRREYVAWGGGHGSHFGNAPYLLDLSSETPGWVVGGSTSPGSLTAQLPAAGEPGAGPFDDAPMMNNDGQYVGDVGLNGAPASSHAYNVPLFADDRLWIMGLSAMGALTTDSSACFAWNRSTRQWSRLGKFIPDADYVRSHFPGNSAGRFCEGMARCYVPDRQEIWGTISTTFNADAPSLVRWTSLDSTIPTVTRWTVGQGVTYLSYTAMTAVYSKAHGRYFVAIADGTDTERLQLFDPANPLKLTTVTWSNPYAEKPLLYGRNGLHFVPSLGAIVMAYYGGADVYYVNVPNDPLTGTWSVRRFTGAGAPDITNGDGNFIYTRWNVVHDMGDGSAAVVFTTTGPNSSPVSSRPTWVLKLPRTLG